MSHNLPADIRERVQAKLSEGGYQSEDEVIRDAMDALDQIEHDRWTQWHERNQLAIEQSRQKLSKPLDAEALMARVRARLAEEGILD